MKKSSMFEKYPDVVEVDDLRKMLGGISRRLAYRLLAEQEIRCIKVGRAYKIPKVCVIEYLMGEDMCRINLSWAELTDRLENTRSFAEKRRKVEWYFSTWSIAIPNALWYVWDVNGGQYDYLL